MESINFIKGYGKVNPSEDQPNFSSLQRHRRRRIIAISLAVFLTLIVASIVAALIHESATETKESEPSALASKSADSLKTVCAVTRYPDSCFSSISAFNSPPSNDPWSFFNLSLHASAIEVSSLRNLVSEPKAEPAMRDCAELFDDARSQLGRSAEMICMGQGKMMMTKMRMSNLQTWISAAMTDQDTCLDGLAEMESTALGEFKVKVQKSQEYVSNTLAILNNIHSLFEKVGLPMP
jgi:pectinesterase inhibitor-like protein